MLFQSVYTKQHQRSVTSTNEITLTGLATVLRKAGRNIKLASRLLNDYDADNSGGLSQEEFETFRSQRKAPAKFKHNFEPTAQSSKVEEDLRDGSTVGAQGGTELMAEALKLRLPDVLLKRFHIVKSRLTSASLSKTKPNIVWMHDLPQDPASAPLSKKKFRDTIAKFVFVSDWQKTAYESYFGKIFTNKAIVLKNAIEPFGKSRQELSPDGKLRLIYHTTPHRGLDILMHVFPRIYLAFKGKVLLDVYSSFSIYGWPQRDVPYEPLFKQCRQHPGCTYHGAVPNNEIRQALRLAHIYAYPSTWMETSCISAIEALSAGVTVVTSSLAALPETVGSFGFVYEYTQDKASHAVAFEKALTTVIATYWDKQSRHVRRVQQVYASKIFGWGSSGFSGRADDWLRMLGETHDDFNGNRQVARTDFESDDEYSDALFIIGRVAESRGDQQTAHKKYLQSIEWNDMNSHTLSALGNLELMLGDAQNDLPLAYRGVEKLEFLIDHPETLKPPVLRDSASYFNAAMKSGFWRKTRQYATRSELSFTAGLNTTKHGDDDCWDLYYATVVPHFPMTLKEEHQRISNYNTRIDSLLRRDDIYCRNPGVGLSNVFSIAYYYDGVDYREQYSRYVQLKLKAFPQLAYTAKDLVFEERDAWDPSSDGAKAVTQALLRRKIRIGVVSSFFSSQSSIWGNFGHIVRGLQRDERLEVDMVYYPRDPIEEADRKLSLREGRNIYLRKMVKEGILQDNLALIEHRRFDVLLYLDAFMTNEMHDLALAKLAPVQMITHGHPVTSGIPQSIMDYFISWDMAEDPDRKKAQSHYTEELLLVESKNQAWEFYAPRTLGENSIVHSIPVPFSQYDRTNLEFIPREEQAKLKSSSSSEKDVTWYFCPQAAFKYHITFDKILGLIQRKDPNAVIILMRLAEPTLLASLHALVVERLVKQGKVDLHRVVFIPRMQHHQLMAMYKLSDVVLDSVFFGGDTTTREAFEVGAPVITLPGKTIGQRWTQAYYRVMGIQGFIAQSVKEYVTIAVKAANASDKEKQQTRHRIKKALKEKLFENEGAPKLWADTIYSALQIPKRWRWSEGVGGRDQHDEL